MVSIREDYTASGDAPRETEQGPRRPRRANQRLEWRLPHSGHVCMIPPECAATRLGRIPPTPDLRSSVPVSAPRPPRRATPEASVAALPRFRPPPPTKAEASARKTRFRGRFCRWLIIDVRHPKCYRKEQACEQPFCRSRARATRQCRDGDELRPLPMINQRRNLPRKAIPRTTVCP